MGGKAKMIEAVQELSKELKAKQITLQSAKVQVPARVYRAGAEQMTVVPNRAEPAQGHETAQTA